MSTTLPAVQEVNASAIRGNEMYLDTAIYERCLNIADRFAKSKLVPSHFQGKPEDCFVIVQLAFRLGIDPFMLLQNTYVISGKPSLEAKIVIALINSSGMFSTKLQWRMEGVGETRKATAFATDKATGNVLEYSVDMAMVFAEGWNKNPKWKSMTDLMLRYRSASMFGRLYCPEVLMGMPTREEAADEVFEVGVPVEVPAEVVEPTLEITREEMVEQYKTWSLEKQEAYQKRLAENKDAGNPDAAKAAYDHVEKYYQ